MNKQEVIEKVTALMKDDQFKSKLSQSESLDEMAAIFQNEGIQVTGDDLKTAYENYQKGEELTDESLESVAGGFAISSLFAAGCILFAGGSMILGYVDGVYKKVKTCRR